MTSITKNLPPVIRDIGVSIIGKTCYINLVENLDLDDVQCLKYALSKGLGIGIVVGGSIMKVPQILTILNAHSARGISLLAYILETLSYAITLGYSHRNNYPFSTYGENFFLTVQNIIIIFLIVLYAPRLQNRGQKLASTFIATATSIAALSVVPTNALAMLQMATLPLSVFSKLPQIRQNARAQSTGQLSAVAVLSQILGCLARLFTTATEVDDLIVSAGFGIALLLNLVLGYQMYAYWPKKAGGKAAASSSYELQQQPGNGGAQVKEEKPFPALSPTTWTAQPAKPLQHRVSTPPPRAQTPTGGKKWTRKVD